MQNTEKEGKGRKRVGTNMVRPEAGMGSGFGITVWQQGDCRFEIFKLGNKVQRKTE